MGQAASLGLTQYDVDELIAYSKGAFNQQEIESLYKRFRALDRGRKGFITSTEFLAIPELSINPLAKRLAYMFESINFKELVGILATMRPAASREDKLRTMFHVYDVDGDGAISEEDMEIVLRQLAGSSLSDEELKSIIRKVMKNAAASDRGLTFAEYRAALEGQEISLHVEVPIDD